MELVGSAAGQQVERVRERGEDRPRGTRARRCCEPGRLQTMARADGAAHAARRACRTARPPSSLARRIASASPGASRSITARVPSGVRSRGPKPVPPVVTTSPANPSARSRSATRDLVDAVGGDLVLDHRRSRRRSSRGDERSGRRGRRGCPRRRRRRRRAPWPRGDAHLGRGLTAARLGGAGSRAPRRRDRRRWKTALPDTRMSTPAAAATRRGVDVDAAVDLDLDRRGRARRSPCARRAPCRAPRG